MALSSLMSFILGESCFVRLYLICENVVKTFSLFITES